MNFIEQLFLMITFAIAVGFYFTYLFIVQPDMMDTQEAVETIRAILETPTP